MKVLYTLLLLISLATALPAQTITLCLDSKTEDGLPIGNVFYDIEPMAPGIPDMDWDVLPCQTFPAGNAITVTANKDINPLNGVSVYDMVLIARHILDVFPLDSPYKILAADINNSGSVSTIDLLELRKVILFINTDFPNNTSWRFLPADFVFPNPQNPWSSSLPDICTINTPGVFEKTFIGVKIGDVNLSSYLGDSLITTENEVRNSRHLSIMDQTFQKGENVSLDFYTENFAQIGGLQFSMDFDKGVLSYNKAKPGSLKNIDESCFGLTEVNNGLLHMAWVNMEIDQVENSTDPLFSLEFTAMESGTLSELISFNPDKLKPELYTSDLKTFNLDLQFSKTNEISSMEVKSVPNPFRGEVNLSFEVQKAGLVEVRVLDLKGSLIKTIEQHMTSGSNTITLSSGIFPAKGIYFYELNTGDRSQSGQLIKQ